METMLWMDLSLVVFSFYFFGDVYGNVCPIGQFWEYGKGCLSCSLICGEPPLSRECRRLCRGYKPPTSTTEKTTVAPSTTTENITTEELFSSILNDTDNTISQFQNDGSVGSQFNPLPIKVLPGNEKPPSTSGSDYSTGEIFGLVIAGVLLVSAVVLIGIFMYRYIVPKILNHIGSRTDSNSGGPSEYYPMTLNGIIPQTGDLLSRNRTSISRSPVQVSSHNEDIYYITEGNVTDWTDEDPARNNSPSTSLGQGNGNFTRVSLSRANGPSLAAVVISSTQETPSGNDVTDATAVPVSRDLDNTQLQYCLTERGRGETYYTELMTRNGVPTEQSSANLPDGVNTFHHPNVNLLFAGANVSALPHTVSSVTDTQAANQQVTIDIELTNRDTADNEATNKEPANQEGTDLDSHKDSSS